MSLDAQAVDELLDLLGTASRTQYEIELLDFPFQTKSQFRPSPTRFSDGSWPVFYSALDKETSEQEIGHHFVSRAINAAEQRTVYYSAFHCRFSGDARDLRTKISDWPDLTSGETENAFCQRLGREAIDIFLDGLLAPSARCAGGTTVPVFTRQSLSDAVIDGDVAFRFDAATNSYTVKYNI